MKKKKLISMTLFLTVIVGSMANIALASGSKICDNDPGTSGCSGTKVSGTWTQTSYSTSYSKDHEINTVIGTAAEYLWGLNTGLTTSTALNLYVNLATSQATCTLAGYYGVNGYIGSLNQAAAPTGLFANYIGYTLDYGTAPIYVERLVDSGNLVADAVKLSW